ncbi:hypothetical protein V6N11_055990 [Hibiscus sabdariffa]|uniref:Protein FAR1-RELATED SEQUENCE n=1 Tax=Hibiscus sabdariffa TaxID=183260 RepID=A0ABR2T2H9_9ROSI
MDKQISEQDKGSGEIESYTDFATSVHSNLSDEIIPRVGMEFNTEQDVYEFYNNYASELGFSIRRSKGQQDQYGRYEELKADYKDNQSKPSLPYPVEEAKIGVAINSSMSTRSNDPKVYVGTRYKTLLRWYSHLAARASMSEQSFDIAMGDGEKTLSKVETTLKQLSIEESLNTCDGEKCQVDANNEKIAKRIKCKPRKKGDGSSIRLKSALEKAARKRNRRNDK